MMERILRSLTSMFSARGVILVVVHDNCTVTCDGYGRTDMDTQNMTRLATSVRDVVTMNTLVPKEGAV